MRLSKKFFFFTSVAVTISAAIVLASLLGATPSIYGGQRFVTAETVMYIDKSASQIADIILDRGTEITEGILRSRIGNVQKFVKALRDVKHMPDVDIGKEILREIGYDEETIEAMPSDTLTDTLAYSELIVEKKFVPVVAQAGQPTRHRICRNRLL